MSRNLKKGFTLIELLVVIAIIGILSAIVLASLNTARDKASDVAVRANLTNVRAQAELHYDNQAPPSYVGACADTNIANALAAATDSGGGTLNGCTDSVGSWIMWAELRTSDGVTGGNTVDVFCVDSSGDAQDLDATQEPGGINDGADATTCTVTD